MPLARSLLVAILALALAVAGSAISPATASSKLHVGKIALTGAAVPGGQVRAELYYAEWGSYDGYAATWYLSSPEGFVPAAGGYTTTLDVPADALGKTVYLAISASSGTQSTPVVESKRLVIGKPFDKAPKPKIIGKPKIGTTVKVKLPKFSPGAKLKIQWFLRQEPIKGATKTTLKITKSMFAEPLTVSVTAIKDGYGLTSTYNASKKTVDY